MKKRFILCLSLLIILFTVLSACDKDNVPNNTIDDKTGITISQDMEIEKVSVDQPASSNNHFREPNLQESEYLKEIFSNLTFLEDPDYKEKDKNTYYNIWVWFELAEEDFRYFIITSEGYVMVHVFNDEPIQDIFFTATKKIDYRIFGQFNENPY